MVSGKDKTVNLAMDDICVLSKEASGLQRMNPHYPGDNGKTRLSIEIANLQIIEIDSHEITLSMHVEMKWSEYRLTMKPSKGEVAYLTPEDKRKIWSPKIFIANNRIIEKREHEEFGFMKEGSTLRKYRSSLDDLGVKKFHLFTKVTCEMDFGTFPFDKHICSLEVS